MRLMTYKPQGEREPVCAEVSPSPVGPERYIPEVHLRVLRGIHPEV